MGCDGGTIPKRDELVKTKKKEVQVSKEVKTAAKWNNCRLSQLPLQKPIVIDLLGFLYNKDCFIEYLLDKSKYESGPSYVKSLKDVKELNLTINPSYNANKKENGHELINTNQSQWICPIAGLEMNGSFKFYCVFSCGCVFSERAFKKINQSNSVCIQCEKPFADVDLIIINPSEEEMATNKAKMALRKEAQTKSKSEKDAKKAKVGEQAEESIPKKTKRSIDSVDRGESALAASKKPKKPTTSLQEDTNVSDVYKSIFNTCEKAKNQQKAHWVTFNPQYF